MKYIVKYFDSTGGPLKYTADVYLEKKPATKKELKKKLKSKIIEDLKNTTTDSDLEIVCWSEA